MSRRRIMTEGERARESDLFVERYEYPWRFVCVHCKRSHHLPILERRLAPGAASAPCCDECWTRLKA